MNTDVLVTWSTKMYSDISVPIKQRAVSQVNINKLKHWGD